ncbi:MAG: PH domain-containing protein [Candidatus Latescibacterota bacterium]
MKFVFPIVPASNGPVWVAAAVLVVMLGVFLLLGYMAYASRHAEFVLSKDGLRIKRDLYGRLVPLSSIVFEQVRTLDLNKDREFRLKWRTNGAGMPGYQAGWFKLRNGEKALAFVTDRQRVVYIPTRDGYSVLLSVAHPNQFEEACRAIRSEL